MAEEKMTKEKLLALRAAKVEAEKPVVPKYLLPRHLPALLSVEDHLSRHPWMSREEAEERFRVSRLSIEEQELYNLEKAKAQLKGSLLYVEGVDEAMADRLVQGGVKYFHTIASSLPYEQFHDIAHQMIGQPAAGC